MRHPTPVWSYRSLDAAVTGQVLWSRLVTTETRVLWVPVLTPLVVYKHRLKMGPHAEMVSSVKTGSVERLIATMWTERLEIVALLARYVSQVRLR